MWQIIKKIIIISIKKLKTVLTKLKTVINMIVELVKQILNFVLKNRCFILFKTFSLLYLLVLKTANMILNGLKGLIKFIFFLWPLHD